jgi:hypothetical protein
VPSLHKNKRFAKAAATNVSKIEKQMRHKTLRRMVGFPEEL